VQGRKGKEDVLVLVSANQEPLTFAELLFIVKHYFESEDSYYPVSAGFKGRVMLANALNEIALGIPFEKVLENYGLKGKSRPLQIEDKMRVSHE
jgi:hypothetical protein